MATIEENRRLMTEVNTKIQAFAEMEKNNGLLTEEQLEQFALLSTQFDDLTASIARLETSERIAADSAKPIAPYNNAAPAVIVKTEAKQYLGAGIARIAMSLAASGGNISDAAKFASEEIHDSNVSMVLSTAQNSGGVLVPDILHNEVIELLRARTVVRQLGARTMTLAHGNLTIPAMTAGATAEYVGEGTDVKASTPTIGEVQLSLKPLIALVPLSNQLLRDSNFNTEQLVLNDILNSIAVREDKAFLRDDGTAGTPKGFKATAEGETPPRVVAWDAAATADLATIDAYLDSLVLMLMNSDSMLIKPGWAISPRSYVKLYSMRDGNGNKVYPELDKGTLKMWPVKHTTTIPTNLGSSSDETEIYFADFNDVIIGDSVDMTIDLSREASYINAAGVMKSSYSLDQSVMRVVLGNGITFRHTTGLVLGTAVKW